VVLVEQDDLASHTSSASSKLIHGGLRYLEYYEFRLVCEALMERERLLAIAPHIIWPLEFVLPHSKEQRPVWMIRLGLFLYDHLAKRGRLARSRAIRFVQHPSGSLIKPRYTKGFIYSDCQVEDSRLVVLNALDARERGAVIRTRTRFLGAKPVGPVWRAEIEDRTSGARETIDARAIANAAGPWVGEVLRARLGRKTIQNVRLVKGSHLIVRRLYEGDYAFTLQNPDKRLVFAIPYEGNFTLIGTTDIPYSGDPSKTTISQEEVDYLCESINRYFRTSITPADVVMSYSGVRPLYEDHAANASAVTRDYVLHLEGGGTSPALLSIFGGKITTYRRLAEHALKKLLPTIGLDTGRNWTAEIPLPGGDIAHADFERYWRAFAARYPFLPAPLARRLARAYGTRAERLVNGRKSLAEFGADLGGGLTQAEVDYLAREEWARTAEDVLWRRSKLILHVSQETAARVENYLRGLGQAAHGGRQLGKVG
jgi:glycerol-3-phosphate dehydrogenase